MNRRQGGPKRLGEKALVRVYMLDNASKVLLADDCTTAEDICHAVTEKLDIADVADMAPLFALYDCLDGATLTRCLEPEELVVPAMAEWDQPERHQLVFMIKLFVDDLLQSTDEKVIYMQYIQAVYMIITGQYPCGPEDCLQLAAFQVRVTFGYGRYHPGFLGRRICEFVPVSLQSDSNNPETWETQVLTRHLSLNAALDLHQARLDYLEIVEAWECYGCSFFPADQEGMRNEAGEALPHRLVLGVNAQGLRIFSREPDVSVQERGRVVYRVNINDMNKWGFVDDEAFYVDLRLPGGSMEQRQLFYTRRGPQIAALMTEYAMELLHHREADETGGSQRYTGDSRDISESVYCVSEPRGSSHGDSGRPLSASRRALMAVPERTPSGLYPADRISAMDGAGGGVLGAGGAAIEGSLLPVPETAARFAPVPHRSFRKKVGKRKPRLEEGPDTEEPQKAMSGELEVEVEDSSMEKSGNFRISIEEAQAEVEDEMDDATDDSESEDGVDEARMLRGIASFHQLQAKKSLSQFECAAQRAYSATVVQAAFRGWRVRRNLFDMEGEMLAMLGEQADGLSETAVPMVDARAIRA